MNKLGAQTVTFQEQNVNGRKFFYKLTHHIFLMNDFLRSVYKKKNLNLP